MGGNTTVFANGMGISHKRSGGKSVVFPDICKTALLVPLPYPNVAKSVNIAGGSMTVKICGEMGTVKDCIYDVSQGDEAGTTGGIATSTFIAQAAFTNYSFDVKIEGRNACRMGDSMTHNNENIEG